MSDDIYISACPSCGLIAERRAYDIGSGPELSCTACEWCWGADGQPLQPLALPTWIAEHIEWFADPVPEEPT